MASFQYQAVDSGGRAVRGAIEAEDRRSALRSLGQQGLIPSSLEHAGATASKPSPSSPPAGTTAVPPPAPGFRGFGSGVKRKEITAFTREMVALLEAAIPIPQALNGLCEEESNPAFKTAVESIAESVRKGASLSSAMDEHPKLFSKLYVSMVRVGEEAGALQEVLSDLADLLEHEDEVRGEVVSAVSYPLFVMGFGIVTVTILLTVVLPKLFTMLNDMQSALPLPTIILLKLSTWMNHYWFLLLLAVVGIVFGIRAWLKTARGAFLWDGWKLRIPILGGVFKSAALSRFARTLGTLVKSGVSLLPALKIVETSIGNLVMAGVIAQVAEETRGGDSLAAPLKRFGLFPKNVIQMVNVGEESGKLDEMLLKVASMEERHMRTKTKTLVSLLGPILILIVGAFVGFMVISLLLPIFKMSQSMH